MSDNTYTKEYVTFIMKEMLTERSSDKCASQKNAVKVACKDDNEPPYSSACIAALKALSKCMDENY